MQANRIEYTVYVLQAYFSIGGPHKAWRDIADWAVPGYARWKKHQHRVDYVGEHFCTGTLVFDNRDTALLALYHARHDPIHKMRDHKIDLKPYRIVERHVLMEQVEVTGSDRLQAADRESTAEVPV